VKSNKKITGKLSHIFEIPEDIANDLPKITLIGNEKITIENYKGLLEFNEKRIKVRTTSNVIEIIGNKLFILEIEKDYIIVKGEIETYSVME